MSIRLAAVQPRSASGPEEPANAAAALDWLARAADEGADLVVFPEGYPGPVNPANTHDGLGPLAEAAARHGVHVVASRSATAGDGRHAVELHLIDDRGRTAGVYRRTSPAGPYIYRDIPAWNFDYGEADAPPAVIETRLGRIGMLVCSEVYVPELSRLLMLQGADLIVYPAGGAINELLEGWRTLVAARAIENLAYTAVCQNLYAPDEEGVGLIAGPEGVLAREAGEGMMVADLDLARLAWLRAEEERIVFPKPYAAIPGVGRWRRPELYGALVAPADRDEAAE
ncbi:MAG: carbon-nitrogen hydrolase family protein [Azospirillaceae bacterium]